MPRILSFDVGVRNLAFIDVSYEPSASTSPGGGPLGVAGTFKVHRWEVIDVMDGAPARPAHPGASAHDTLARALVSVLDHHFMDPANLRYDHVLIENQPCNHNPAMKSVQMILFTFFHMLRHYAGCVDNVRLVSATRKLQLAHGAPAGEHADADATVVSPQVKPTYKDRKREAVRLCEHYLGHVFPAETREAWLGVFRAHKKKDDLSDAAMQAVWFAESSEKGAGKATAKATSASKATAKATSASKATAEAMAKGADGITTSCLAHVACRG